MIKQIIISLDSRGGVLQQGPLINALKYLSLAQFALDQTLWEMGLLETAPPSAHIFLQAQDTFLKPRRFSSHFTCSQKPSPLPGDTHVCMCAGALHRHHYTSRSLPSELSCWWGKVLSLSPQCLPPRLVLEGRRNARREWVTERALGSIHPI